MAPYSQQERFHYREPRQIEIHRQGVGVMDGGVEMKRIALALPVLLMIAGIMISASCSEKSPTATEQDSTVPETWMVYPTPSTNSEIMDVSDSLLVYVAAKDNVGVSKLEIWAKAENQESANLIATLTTPLAASQIPDSLRPADGSPVYRTTWITREIINGTIVQLFSRAYDAAQNVTRSAPTTVRILNQGGNLSPPRPQITANPRGGTVETVFTFDAAGTQDDIDDPEQILVRWDLNGDGAWEHDWAEELPATAPVTFRYTTSGQYLVKVEARNTYLTSQTGTATLLVEVTNVGGDPNPLEPDNMILIPAGIYHVGAADSVGSDRIELPVHEVRITADYRIERTEVPNRLYILYLRFAMAKNPPQVLRDGNHLLLVRNKVEPVEADSVPVVCVDMNNSALFYDPDGDSVAVGSNDQELPMVGVSWYGAKAYAEWRGLRLPTEHEWEVAAKADSVSFIYPWGRTIQPDQANYNANPSDPKSLKPRGSYPNARSPFGILDQSGNAAEWVKDWLSEYPAGQVTNPEGPVTGTMKVIRGGSYIRSFSDVRVVARRADEPTATSSEVGFRTAYTE
jgi:formylglycine-generating enzyme required for sulfatase activity